MRHSKEWDFSLPLEPPHTTYYYYYYPTVFLLNTASISYPHLLQFVHVHVPIRVFCTGKLARFQEHILCECKATGQQEIWTLAKELWEKKNKTPIKLLVGSLLNAVNATYLSQEEHPLTGDQRLCRILMSESVYLIWKMRNKRAITDEGWLAVPAEIRNKWLYTINNRLHMDCRMTNTHWCSKKP